VSKQLAEKVNPKTLNSLQIHAEFEKSGHKKENFENLLEDLECWS